jgi:hypothetical protein
VEYQIILNIKIVLQANIIQIPNNFNFNDNIEKSDIYQGHDQTGFEAFSLPFIKKAV